MAQQYSTWQEFLLALQSGDLTKDQFKNRRQRARKANNVKLCLAMARAFELYQLETLYKKD